MVNDDVVHLCAAGIDISKSDAYVCVRRSRSGSSRPVTEVRRFGSTVPQVEACRQWLVECGVECVAMESTSAYWMTFWQGLEHEKFELVLSNAHQVKQLRGRKTDIKDCVWLAKLAALGVAPVSFVPPPEVRDLRLATRHRVKLVGRMTSLVASLEKLLEDTGLKLSEASSKLLTVSGRRILDATCAGTTDPTMLAHLSQLRKTTGDALVEALTMRLRPIHTPLIQSLLRQIDTCTEETACLDALIAMVTPWCEPQIVLLDTIPGIDRVLATTIIAETGVDMSVFPTAGHLASWAGVAPGSHQSAKMRRHAGVIQGNTHLKASLGQAARSAVNTKDTFLRARFYRLCAHHGEAKAYTAISHSIAISLWHMLTKKEPYRDHGSDY